MHHSHGRATLGGKLSAVLVAAGSSVGLGNIWRFPYVAGDNGGGAFLVIYILCVLLLGLPIMVAEFSVGRASHRNAVGAYRVDLLHAAVTAAHASRHDHQYRFLHIRFLPYLSRSRGRIFMAPLYSILDRKTI